MSRGAHMNLQPAEAARSVEAVSSWRGDLTTAESHCAGLLHGATLTGEAARRQLSIRIGLWLDEGGRVRQARWRAVEDPALRGYAEVACRLLESGADPVRLDGDALRNSAHVAPAGHGDRADLVAAAVHAALLLRGM